MFNYYRQGICFAIADDRSSQNLNWFPFLLLLLLQCSSAEVHWEGQRSNKSCALMGPRPTERHASLVFSSLPLNWTLVANKLWAFNNESSSHFHWNSSIVHLSRPARLLVALASLEPVKILSSSPPHRKAPSKWALTIAHFHLTCLGLPLIKIINQLTVMRCCYFIKQQDWRCCVISPNGLPPNSHLWRWRRWWWSMEGTGSDNNSRCGPSHLLAWLKAWP